LKERRILVSAISPGVVPTCGYNTFLGMSQTAVDQFVNAAAINILLGRPGTTDEIAQAISFLAQLALQR
jgi:NAD(P)-dependent dehydrogenase (short-subunit alcohol dehydrogenase family)